MTDFDASPDAYNSAGEDPALQDPDGDLVTLIVSRLYQEPDPVTRWRAVRALDDRRLNEVRAVTVHQLLQQGASYQAAADALGVSKARVQQLADGRGDASPGDASPAYAWGRLLAVCEDIAVRTDPTHTRARRSGPHAAQADKAIRAGMVQTTGRASLLQACHRWLRRLDDQELAGRIDVLAAEVAALPGGHLPLKAREQVVFGYHQERADQQSG